MIHTSPFYHSDVLSNAAPVKRRVGIVTGGGSGHEPAFIGYTWQGMCNAVASGELFSSPTAKSFAEAIWATNDGAGVAVLYGNDAGDNINVKIAIGPAAKDGSKVGTVVANGAV